jgi:hypothetical protein
MSTGQTATTSMTAIEFARLADDGQRRELLAGEVPGKGDL